MTESPYQHISFSNALSYGSLCCGLAAIFAARDSASWEAAALFLALSALADTFDGRFARRFKRTPTAEAFGVQLDSLVDAVCFGVAPVVCLSLLIRVESSFLRLLWIAAASFHVLCAVTRLGFYNLQPAKTTGFIGVPTTAAALLWSTVFLLRPTATIAVLGMAVIGVAMIAPVPVPRPRGTLMFAYLFWIVVLLARAGIVLSRNS